MTGLYVSNVLLWILVLALALVCLALTRQVGILHERTAPVGALVLGNALKPGDLAPVVELHTLDGRPLSLGVPQAEASSGTLVPLAPLAPLH